MNETPLLSAFLCLFVLAALISLVFVAASIRIVPEHRRLAIYRLGKYIGERGPGIVLVIPLLDRAVLIDTRDKDRPASDSRTPGDSDRGNDGNAAQL